MEWKTYPKNKPNESGTYLVSITISHRTFNYMAHYDQKTDSWFKYDPFSNKNDVLEQIEFKINGWKNPSVYLG